MTPQQFIIAQNYIHIDYIFTHTHEVKILFRLLCMFNYRLLIFFSPSLCCCQLLLDEKFMEFYLRVCLACVKKITWRRVWEIAWNVSLRNNILCVQKKNTFNDWVKSISVCMYYAIKKNAMKKWNVRNDFEMRSRRGIFFSGKSPVNNFVWVCVCPGKTFNAILYALTCFTFGFLSELYLLYSTAANRKSHWSISLFLHTF